MGHWYPIVSIDFHEHAMTGMMVFKQGYALVFGPSDARKPYQGRGCPRDYVAEKGMHAEIGRSVIAHTPTPNVQHNTYTYIWCSPQCIYVHKVQHNEYTCHDTMTTQYT